MLRAWILAAAYMALAWGAYAQTATLTVCKRTLPSPDPSNTSFTFSGVNTWTSGANSFASRYGPSFVLADGQCKTLTLGDMYNKITEAIPSGWRLRAISCNHTTSYVNFSGSAPKHPNFTNGDNTLEIDQNEAAVTCTFTNTAANPACIVSLDLSTGIAPWSVKKFPLGTPQTAYPTTSLPAWANKEPSGAPFPVGVTWVQPSAAGTPQDYGPGIYTYALSFSIPACVQGTVDVHGWFAADNTAALQIDGQPVSGIPCAGNLFSQCFKQAFVTLFSVPVSSGAHTLTITVGNSGLQSSASGLVVRAVVP